MKKLKDDVKEIFTNLFGPEVAKQVDEFEKPDMYPKDFLDQSVYFLGKFIGEDSARKKLEPLYKKYLTEENISQKKTAKGRSK
jgi:hypothetical protein